MSVLNFEQIKQILPQRFPFLMIDTVEELDPGKKVIAIKNLSGNEIHFIGHFPDNAVMPAALIVEAMAQAGIIIHQSINKQMDSEKRKYYLGSINTRFFEPVYPGDQLKIVGETAKMLPANAFISCVVWVGDKKIAEGDLIFAVKK